MKYLGKFKLSEEEVARGWKMENNKRVAIRRIGTNSSISTQIFSNKIYERTRLENASGLTVFRQTGKLHFSDDISNGNSI